ncbi:hypothetical protein [Pyrobaculum aerophilum]|uniref:Uncharacterized protein n=1 Tax=Pyrobaculum aerophilum TaxID=13773 RepID=A0A371R5Y4_9CREN|nr:hypothetical protein [Pyrobaculum aerophilum]RFA94163.1 hypothetical protein CGL51_11120 [Pyrobaculum aerophilum]RFA99421.1 hypothetical protein CGL52_03405 [Pyrobaculum aerophilum]
MARKRKNYKPLIALAAIALAGLAAATMTFTNYTLWLINATLPPAMKYAGDDTSITGRSDGSGYDRYIYVSWYVDTSTGLNITRISVVGFTGDVVNYTNALKLCNKYYSDTLNVQLQLSQIIDEGYASDIRYFRVQFEDDSSRTGVEARGTTITVPWSGYVKLPYGECKTLGVHILVDADLPESARDGKTELATYEIRVHFST